MKTQLKNPTLFMLYGYPGAGKTYFARQLCDTVQAAHIQADKIRWQLFDEPKYDKDENRVVEQIMEYMAEEFLRTGVSVVYDYNALRVSNRRSLRELARKNKAQSVLVWLQIDPTTAAQRAAQRDRRTIDDKFAAEMTQDMFQRIASGMQNPGATEDYIVISGKHVFDSQRASVIKKLYDFNILDMTKATANVPKPGMVNLIPNMPRKRAADARRNIRIR